MRRSQWTTYAITGYTHQVGNDPRATGGVHLYQIRRKPGGVWMRRIVDSNGHFESAGPVELISAADGQTRFEQALARS